MTTREQWEEIARGWDRLGSRRETPARLSPSAAYEGVPDAIWPSDNEWGVPTLLLDGQALAVAAPVLVWGTGGRKHIRFSGTWHFYTDDYRFERLWKDPAPVAQTGAVAAAEVNFTVTDQYPVAMALYQTYRKRWLSRYWQSLGMRIFVDLNVGELHREMNLLGVPKGWTAWATRGYTARLDALRREYEAACEHAGTREILFVICGGGAQVKDAAREIGAVWIPEQRDIAKGKEKAYGEG